jgi:hypothetical protein
MVKAAFNKNKTLFTSKMGLNLRKKLVKCYIWSVDLYSAETCTFQKVLKCGAGTQRDTCGMCYVLRYFKTKNYVLGVIPCRRAYTYCSNMKYPKMFCF